MPIKCRKNSCKQNEDEFHHIIPKSIGGTDKHGRTYLCKKHHEIIHKKIATWIFYNKNKEKQEIYNEIQRRTKQWLQSHKN